MRDFFSFVQFSDTHIAPEGSDFDKLHAPSRMLRNAVQTVNELPFKPAFVLVTGDLVNDGKTEDYHAFKSIMSGLDIPWYLMPGNHDCRHTMREAFADHDYWQDDTFLHFTIDGNPLRIVCLDSIMPGSSNGEICQMRVDWLEKTLAEDTDTPTILATHQPPISVGFTMMDRTRIDNGNRALHDLIEKTPNVIGLTCGHLHRPVGGVWAGKRLNVALSTAFHLAMDLSGEERIIVTDEPPGFQVHMVSPDSGWLTHTALIGDFACHKVCG